MDNGISACGEGAAVLAASSGPHFVISENPHVISYGNFDSRGFKIVITSSILGLSKKCFYFRDLRNKLDKPIPVAKKSPSYMSKMSLVSLN